MASPETTLTFLTFIRVRFSLTLFNLISSKSKAIISESGASSARWVVFPPGAQQASKIESFFLGDMRYPANCADTS